MYLDKFDDRYVDWKHNNYKRRDGGPKNRTKIPQGHGLSTKRKKKERKKERKKETERTRTI